jgi:hypothetical protein
MDGSMDVSAPEFNTYEARFNALAEQVQLWEGARHVAGCSEHVLCLYGENGLTCNEEFELLNALEQHHQANPQRVAKIMTEGDYWCDTILFTLPTQGSL